MEWNVKDNQRAEITISLDARSPYFLTQTSRYCGEISGGGSVVPVQAWGTSRHATKILGIAAFRTWCLYDEMNKSNFFTILVEELLSFGRIEWSWSKDYEREVSARLCVSLMRGIDALAAKLETEVTSGKES